MGKTYVILTPNNENIVIDPTDQWFFTYHQYRSDGKDLRKLIGDDLLKEAGIFGDVLMAETVYEYFQSKYTDPKEADIQISDYFFYRWNFEHEDADERKLILHPHFLERIERYLYNFEEQPENMCVWNYPICGIQRMGLANEVLNLR